VSNRTKDIASFVGKAVAGIFLIWLIQFLGTTFYYRPKTSIRIEPERGVYSLEIRTRGKLTSLNLIIRIPGKILSVISTATPTQIRQISKSFEGSGKSGSASTLMLELRGLEGHKNSNFVIRYEKLPFSIELNDKYLYRYRREFEWTIANISRQLDPEWVDFRTGAIVDEPPMELSGIQFSTGDEAKKVLWDLQHGVRIDTGVQRHELP
jgi:hypothetical protein